MQNVFVIPSVVKICLIRIYTAFEFLSAVCGFGASEVRFQLRFAVSAPLKCGFKCGLRFQLPYCTVYVLQCF